MEKFKNTLMSVNKFGVLALMLVAFGTLAFTPSKNLATKKWAFDSSAPANSQWQDVTGQQQSSGSVIRDYACDESSATCTAEFDESVNPNLTPSAPRSNVILGDYIPE